ncbi:hypothetical protein RF11_12760 [Thelohanellus kitauei]|uniref:Uncharacterized protein n=1 Tax=Thelohanellus kitauei TaxID=669202 RepID=A0A0C2MI65_THEKT|nr:hypothetical protein RF11_12760 [Thelohanellus kitauei]
MPSVINLRLVNLHNLSLFSKFSKPAFNISQIVIDDHKLIKMDEVSENKRIERKSYIRNSEIMPGVDKTIGWRKIIKWCCTRHRSARCNQHRDVNILYKIIGILLLIRFYKRTVYNVKNLSEVLKTFSNDRYLVDEMAEIFIITKASLFVG